MPPKKNVQQQLDDQADIFRAMMVEFQQNMRHTMQTSIEAAVRAAVHGNRRAPDHQNLVDPIFEVEDENVDIEDNNQFAGLRENLGQQQQWEVVVAPRGDFRRWDMGFKVDLPEFHAGCQPEELLDWISATEEALAFKQVSDDMCVALVATSFKGRASTWW